MAAQCDRGWVIVSGGGGELGSALARHYAEGGQKVLALDRNCDRLNADGLTDGITCRNVDATAEGDVREALQAALPEKDKISLLINAAGLIWNEPVLSFRGMRFAAHDIANWRRVIEANLTAPFVVAVTVAARMARKGGGAIINFSSISSAGNAGQAAYSAAKAGIEGLTRTMAIELGPLGIRVNAVSLGFVDVASTRSALTEAQLKDYAGKTPVGRLGQLTDVIGAVEFLERNSFVNGEVLKVDGGLRI